MNTKDTNPKDAVGSMKAFFSTISARVLGELGLAMLEGALKYGRHNYRVAGVRASVYYDAALRHLMAFWEGEDVDPDSGVSHVTKAIAGLVVLRDSMLIGNWHDDRPPRLATGWIADLNAKSKALVEKCKEPMKPYTEIGLRSGNTVLASYEKPTTEPVADQCAPFEALRPGDKCPGCSTGFLHLPESVAAGRCIRCRKELVP